MTNVRLQINRWTYLLAFSVIQPLRSNNRNRWGKEQWHISVDGRKRSVVRAEILALARSCENWWRVPNRGCVWQSPLIGWYLGTLGRWQWMRAEGRLNICCWRRNSRCSDGSKRGERGRARGSACAREPRFYPGAVPTQVQLAPQNADAKLKYRG